MIAQTPPPPYYSVIFTSLKSKNEEGYAEMAKLMVQLAQQQDGFLGIESAKSEIGITVSYWKDTAAIKAWKQQVDHKMAQQKGREQWYDAYSVRIAKVERDYNFGLFKKN